MSVITELELLGYPDITEEVLQIKRFLEDCTVIEINEEIKSTYSHLRKKYRLKLGDEQQRQQQSTWAFHL